MINLSLLPQAIVGFDFVSGVSSSNKHATSCSGEGPAEHFYGAEKVPHFSSEEALSAQRRGGLVGAAAFQD